ncbi:hypothetical protein Lal_00047230 [Lupinus albus]|nr:hypothetical protein Lal_00047230 [Lupinus albus]
MWNSQGFGKIGGDVEAGERPLYPMMVESPDLRWSFIRKVYSIIAIQLIATVAVGFFVLTVHPVANFFLGSTAGLVVYILIIFVPFITLCPLSYYYQKHPVNYLLLAIFTISIAFAVGLSCAFTDEQTSIFELENVMGVLDMIRNDCIGGEKLDVVFSLRDEKVILEAVILTAVVVIALTLYTFWAASRGQDFNFLGPFLFGAVIVLIVFGFIQVLFPLGKISTMIYGCIAAIIFCGYIVYDTDNLIKRYSYDEYIWASVSLYLDIINLFLSLLSIFRAADN